MQYTVSFNATKKTVWTIDSVLLSVDKRSRHIELLKSGFAEIPLTFWTEISTLRGFLMTWSAGKICLPSYNGTHH